jgi:hypothetical protein
VEFRRVTLYDGERGYDFRASYPECAAPCRLIWVTVPAGGSLAVQLTPGNPARKLSVFTNEGNIEYCCATQLTIPFMFSNAGEEMFYVKFADGLRAKQTAGSTSRLRFSRDDSLGRRVSVMSLAVE